MHTIIGTFIQALWFNI